jgi:hypothetical protein
MNKMEKLLLLKKLNELIPGANAEFKIKVIGSDCEIENEGNVVGMLIALSSLVKLIKEKFEKKIGTEDNDFLLETSFQNGMDEKWGI